MNYGEDEDEIKKKVPINVTNANFSHHKVKIRTNYSRVCVCVLVCQRRPFSWGGSFRALVSQPTEVMLLLQQQQQQPTASSAMMSAWAETDFACVTTFFPPPSCWGSRETSERHMRVTHSADEQMGFGTKMGSTLPPSRCCRCCGCCCCGTRLKERRICTVTFAALAC